MRVVLVAVVVAALASCTIALAAGSKVSVTEKEFKVTPAQTSAKAGSVTFSVKDVGQLQHEFIVLKTNLAASKLPVKGSTAVLKGTVVGRIAKYNPGQTKTLTVNLKAGHYVLLCNLPAHYAAGQHTDFTVK